MFFNLNKAEKTWILFFTAKKSQKRPMCFVGKVQNPKFEYEH